jgi:hypothetical protein
MYRKLIPLSLVLLLALSACDMHITLPGTQKTGPLQVDEISVPMPSGDSPSLKLKFGAGTLKLKPGANGMLSGTASYNVPDFKPTLSVKDGDVILEQGNYKLNGIPDLGNIKNIWDFKLGAAPMALSIEAGAYKGEFELGGLALTSLTVQDGAAETSLTFSEPNKVEMTTLRYETGASNVSLVGLAHANLSMLVFKSGAGNYTLDFTGKLLQDIHATIETGVSNMTLVIPQGVAVELTVDSGLSNVSVPGDWTKRGNIYTQEGNGPSITILLTIGAGNLTITD